MPYIDKTRRKHFDNILDEYKKLLKNVRSFGDLNYLITNLLISYLEENGKNYTTLNGLIGVLECAKQEFYRKIVTPYEEEKIKENGDL